MGFWTAEEDGLIGSERYVRGLSRAQRRRIVAYVNYDMVGSPNAVPEVYDTDDGLERLLRRLYPGREGETSAAAASDQLSFAAAGIRVSGFYTGSSEEDRRGRPRDPCYHRACDDLDNVDRTIAARAATALGRMLATLAARRWP
jgi:aminopeptidase S